MFKLNPKQKELFFIHKMGSSISDKDVSNLKEELKNNGFGIRSSEPNADKSICLFLDDDRTDFNAQNKKIIEEHAVTWNYNAIYIVKTTNEKFDIEYYKAQKFSFLKTNANIHILPVNQDFKKVISLMQDLRKNASQETSTAPAVQHSASAPISTTTQSVSSTTQNTKVTPTAAPTQKIPPQNPPVTTTPAPLATVQQPSSIKKLDGKISFFKHHNTKDGTPSQIAQSLNISFKQNDSSAYAIYTHEISQDGRSEWNVARQDIIKKLNQHVRVEYLIIGDITSKNNPGDALNFTTAHYPPTTNQEAEKLQKKPNLSDDEHIKLLKYYLDTNKLKIRIEKNLTRTDVIVADISSDMNSLSLS